MPDTVFRTRITPTGDGGLCMRLELPADALGVIGHDRIRVTCDRSPTLHHALGILSNMRARQRGEALPPIITVTVPRLFVARWATYDDGLVFTLTLSAAWGSHKPAAAWQHVLGRYLAVEGPDGRTLPLWADLARLAWDLDADGEVAA